MYGPILDTSQFELTRKEHILRPAAGGSQLPASSSKLVKLGAVVVGVTLPAGVEFPVVVAIAVGVTVPEAAAASVLVTMPVGVAVAVGMTVGVAVRAGGDDKKRSQADDEATTSGSVCNGQRIRR